MISKELPVAMCDNEALSFREVVAICQQIKDHIRVTPDYAGFIADIIQSMITAVHDKKRVNHDAILFDLQQAYKYVDQEANRTQF